MNEETTSLDKHLKEMRKISPQAKRKRRIRRSVVGLLLAGALSVGYSQKDCLFEYLNKRHVAQVIQTSSQETDMVKKIDLLYGTLQKHPNNRELLHLTNETLDTFMSGKYSYMTLTDKIESHKERAEHKTPYESMQRIWNAAFEKDRKNTIQMLEEASELAPYWSYTHGILSTAYLQDGQYKKALYEITKSLEIFPEADGVMLDYGVCLRFNKRHIEAVEVLRNRVKEESKAIYHYSYGISLMHCESPELALKHLIIADEKEPGNWLVQHWIASAYAQKGQLDQALDHLYNAYNINPAKNILEQIRAVESHLQNPE